LEIESKLTSIAVKGRFVPKDLPQKWENARVAYKEEGRWTLSSEENVSLLPKHSFAVRLHWLVHIFGRKRWRT
jgi:hypothetical protein